MAQTTDTRPIVRKVTKKSVGGGHHGGAWKVAYADFVTAMMAFFLLMWLLNATTEKQRKGLADYFDPSIPVSKVTAGGAGMLEGDSVLVEERRAGSQVEGVRPRPTHAEPGPGVEDRPAAPDLPVGEAPPQGLARTPPEIPEDAAPPGAEAFAAAYAAEQARLDALGAELRAAMAEAGDDLSRHFLLRMTPEGLVIEIVDLVGEPLFQSGSAAPSPVATQLMEVLVPVLARVRNGIAVVGHTDATPFAGAEDYTNWELSADRANTARRLMQAAGLDEARIAHVSGKAATEPLSTDAVAAKNRRIALILLRGPGR